jgi:Tfp pilus assembly protein PilW
MLTLRRRLRRLSNSRGFTLMELVVAMALGMIVILAAFTVIDRTFLTNKAISDREDALQRGRLTLEQMTRQIRSMTCAGQATPVTVGKDDSMSFYTYMGDPTATGATQLPELHTLSWANSTITEQDFKVTDITTTPPTVAATAYRTRKLLTNVDEVGGSTPIFTYYSFDQTAAAGSGALVQLVTNNGAGLTTTDLARVVKVQLNFVVRPTGIKVVDPHSTTFEDDVFWRAIDPETPNALPCSQGV